jgi:hypothetical protein
MNMGRSDERPVLHHEESDVNLRAVFTFAGWLATSAVVIHLLLWGVFVYFERREQRTAGGESPLAAGQEERLPPEPRLQVTPRQDLQDLRAREDEILNGYSWVDRNAGIVRIPIEEAMRIVVERGLTPPAQGGSKPEQSVPK